MSKNKQRWHGMALGLFAVIAVVQIARNTSMWFLAIILGLVAYYFLGWRISRAVQLRRRGYYRGRMIERPEFGRDWIYEEVHENELRELRLPVEHTDPGRWDVFIPSEDQWPDVVPPWAENRREEIVSRISAAIGSDRVRLDSNGKVT